MKKSYASRMCPGGRESQVGPALGLVLVTTQTLVLDSGGAQVGKLLQSWAIHLVLVVVPPGRT